MEADLPPNIVIDCSHGNSEKDYSKQPTVFEEGLKQIHDGNDRIVGIMLESNINAGGQKIPSDLTGFDRSTLEYGVSSPIAVLIWKQPFHCLRLHIKASRRDNPCGCPMYLKDHSEGKSPLWHSMKPSSMNTISRSMRGPYA